MQFNSCERYIHLCKDKTIQLENMVCYCRVSVSVSVS